MARKPHSLEHIGLALMGASAVAVAGIVHLAITSVGAEASTGPAYALIMEYQGDAFALDTGMTLGDCFEAMPRNDVAHGMYYACERDPAGGVKP